MTTRTVHPRIGVVLVCIALITASAACSKSNKTTTTSDSGGAITVWLDAPRIPGVNVFKKAHPEIPIKVVTIATADSSSTLQEKFTLFNQAGKGWPDAIFYPDNGDIAWASGTKIHYTADLTNGVSSSIKSGYDAATIAPCMIDNKLQCLRNDTAPTMFWYNTKLFKQWGYTPPTTWEQYTATALKIAAQHTGYISGLIGDGYSTGRYLWSSGCPISQSAGTLKALINNNDPRCTRVKDMLSKLLAAKAVSTAGIFDTAAAGLGSKLAMTPGAVWYGDYLFRDTMKIPAGQMTAGPSLYWSTDSTHITGDEGGGLYGVSSHIKGKELKNALIFTEWMVSAPAWQVDLSTGLPAYGPLRHQWLAKQNADGYFADFATMEKAILAAPALVSTNYQYLLYDPTAAWINALTPVITKGGSFNDGWTAFISELKNKAKTVGYQVKTSG